MDILFSTPLRDIQVFDPKSFAAISNIGLHDILSPTVAAFNIIGSLPFIAKLFFKDHVNNLGKMLDQLAAECDIKLDLQDDVTKKKTLERLNLYLKKRGFYHLQADILQKNNKTKLKFKYIDPMADLLDEHWIEIKDKPMMDVMNYILTPAKDTANTKGKYWTRLLANSKQSKNVGKQPQENGIIADIKKIFEPGDQVDQTAIQRVLQLLKENSAGIVKLVQTSNQFSAKQKDALTILSRIYGCFIDKEGNFDPTFTLQKSRENFVEKINAVSMSDAANNAYGTINDYTFSFWLSYFTYDLIDGRDDMSLWDHKSQVAVLAVAGAVSGIQLILKLINYFKNKQKSDTPLEKYYSNKALKHQILEEFFIDEIKAKQLEKAHADEYQYPFNIPLATKKIDRILSNQEENQDLEVVKQFNLLQEKYGPNKSTLAKRATTVLTNMMDQAILVSFIGWVVGAICMTAGALVVGAVFLSTPVGLGVFALGMFLGATWFADRQIQKDKAKEANMAIALEKNAPKMHELAVLENQNKALRGLLKEKGIQPLTVIKAHDDRGFRRLTTTKGGAWTTVKKVFNRTFFGIGKAGSGILIMRLAVLPIFTLGCVAIALSNPVTLGIALGFGAVWAAFNVYKYHQDKKLAKCERTLEDIDNRLAAAKATQEVYLDQLRYSKTNDREYSPIQQTITPSQTPNPNVNTPKPNQRLSLVSEDTQEEVERSKNSAPLSRSLR